MQRARASAHHKLSVQAQAKAVLPLQQYMYGGISTMHQSAFYCDARYAIQDHDLGAPKRFRKYKSSCSSEAEQVSNANSSLTLVLSDRFAFCCASARLRCSNRHLSGELSARNRGRFKLRQCKGMDILQFHEQLGNRHCANRSGNNCSSLRNNHWTIRRQHDLSR